MNVCILTFGWITYWCRICLSFLYLFPFFSVISTCLGFFFVFSYVFHFSIYLFQASLIFFLCVLANLFLFTLLVCLKSIFVCLFLRFTLWGHSFIIHFSCSLLLLLPLIYLCLRCAIYCSCYLSLIQRSSIVYSCAVLLSLFICILSFIFFIYFSLTLILLALFTFISYFYFRIPLLFVFSILLLFLFITTLGFQNIYLRFIV